jgi:hypothetical protein
MDRQDGGKTLEIPAVECEQMRHAMYFKHSHKMSIVDLNASHIVRKKQPTPNLIYPFIFGQKRHSPLDRLNMRVGLLNR